MNIMEMTMSNLAESIVDEWFNRMDGGYVVYPYTKRELRVLDNVIRERSDEILEFLTRCPLPMGEKMVDEMLVGSTVIHFLF